MTLQKFIADFNGYNRIGGGLLYELFKHDQIVHENDIDKILTFLRNCAPTEIEFLINEEIKAEDRKFALNVLDLSRYALQLEKKTESREEIKMSDLNEIEYKLGEIDEDDEDVEDDEDDDEEEAYVDEEEEGI